MTAEFEEQLAKVQSLCEEYNVPVKNLRRYHFVPDDLKEEHQFLKELAEDDEATHHILEKEIARGVSLDPNRIRKHYLWDIAVKEKREHAIEEYSELLEEADQNLIEVPTGADWNKNGFEYEDNYLIFAQPIVSNFHLTTFLLNNNPDELSLELLFSHDKLGIPETTRTMHLFEHWDGPENIERIRESGDIKHVSIHGGETYAEGFADKTEFLFEEREGRWHLHIEETLPRKGVRLNLGTQYRNREIDYNTRYIHAITDSNLTECYHIDGAIREYPNKETFIERHQMTFSEDNIFKDMCERHKVFKMDSESAAIPDYQKVIGLFFKYNPYVLEFFEGETEWSKELEEWRKEQYQFDFDFREKQGLA